jgi:hypothetical protein
MLVSEIEEGKRHLASYHLAREEYACSSHVVTLMQISQSHSVRTGITLLSRDESIVEADPAVPAALRTSTPYIFRLAVLGFGTFGECRSIFSSGIQTLECVLYVASWEF